jgi:hypothetical protein
MSHQHRQALHNKRRKGPNALSDDFTRHTCLGSIDQRLFSQNVHLDAQLLLHELDSLLACQPVPSNDGRRVNLGFNQFVRATEQLRSDDHHRRRPIADFLILLLCQIDKNASCGVLDRK